jgi:hypothetical protein
VSENAARAIAIGSSTGATASAIKTSERQREQ